jgi:hypothetical protein
LFDSVANEIGDAFQTPLLYEIRRYFYVPTLIMVVVSRVVKFLGLPPAIITRCRVRCSGSPALFSSRSQSSGGMSEYVTSRFSASEYSGAKNKKNTHLSLAI